MSAVPWYNTGTVGVTNGSPIVTGASTLWTANVDTGQGFIGPDFALYEIASVDSDAQLTLKTNYRGSTVASLGFYVIPPIQGYTRSAAIQLAALLSNLNGFATLTPSDGDFIQYLSGAWQTRSISQVQAAVGANLMTINFSSENIAARPLSTVIGRSKAVVNFTVPSVANGLVLTGQVDNAAGADTDFQLLKNGTLICTARFAAGAETPTAIDTADAPFAALTDYLDLKTPASFNGMTGAFCITLLVKVT